MARLLKLYMPTAPYELFSTVLDGQIVQLIFVWNERMRSYTVTVMNDSGDTFVEGQALDYSTSIDLILLDSAFDGVLYLIENFEATSYYDVVQNPEDVSKYYGLYYATFAEE